MKMQRQLVEVNGVSCEVIATYFDENTSKNYIIYTDNTKNEKQELNVYYGLYEIVDNQFIVKEITSLEDKKIILEILDEIKNTI